MQERGPVEACLGRHAADDREWREQGRFAFGVSECRGILGGSWDLVIGVIITLLTKFHDPPSKVFRMCLGFRMTGVHDLV